MKDEKKVKLTEITEKDLEQVNGGIRDARLTEAERATAEFVVVDRTVVKPVTDIEEVHAFIERTN